MGSATPNENLHGPCQEKVQIQNLSAEMDRKVVWRYPRQRSRSSVFCLGRAYDQTFGESASGQVLFWQVGPEPGAYHACALIDQSQVMLSCHVTLRSPRTAHTCSMVLVEPSETDAKLLDSISTISQLIISLMRAGIYGRNQKHCATIYLGYKERLRGHATKNSKNIPLLRS